jgi:hypothetical protein
MECRAIIIIIIVIIIKINFKDFIDIYGNNFQFIQSFCQMHFLIIRQR